MATNRYNVMGYKPVQRDTNAGLTPAMQDKQPPEVVIYSTDDADEAKRIVKAGGYIDSSDTYFPATRVVDTTPDPSATSTTVRKGQVR